MRPRAGRSAGLKSGNPKPGQGPALRRTPSPVTGEGAGGGGPGAGIEQGGTLDQAPVDHNQTPRLEPRPPDGGGARILTQSLPSGGITSAFDPYPFLAKTTKRNRTVRFEPL